MHQARIESNPAVMMGKPVVAGTRITVESILERLGAGESIENILEAHPPSQKAEIVLGAVTAHGTEMQTAFTVITSKIVRIRPKQ